MAANPFRNALPQSLPSITFSSSIRTSTLRLRSGILVLRRHESTRRRLVKRLTLPGAPALKTHKVLNLDSQHNLPSSSHIVFNPPPATPNVFHTPLKFLPEGDVRRKFYENKATPSMYNLPTSGSQDGKDDFADVFKGGNVFKEAARALGYGRDSISPSTIRRNTAEPFTVSPVTVPGTALHSIPHTYPAGLAPRLPDVNVLPPLTYKVKPEPRILTQSEVYEIRRLRKTDPDQWTISKLCKKYGCNFGIIRAIWANHEAGAKHDKELKNIKEKWGRRRRVARMERSRRKALWEMDA